jgi:hypothetical protein
MPSSGNRTHIPEDGILHSHRYENLKSYIVFLYGEASHRDLHGGTSQKTALFIVTAMKTSNPT